jgi:ATP-dependent DNA helicase UvrD/PcrA
MTFIPNSGQERAINAPLDRPIRVVAGAGTGKTEVIAQRYLYLLREHHLRPENILVLTFSEKAAAEMRARILLAVSQAGLGWRRLDLAAASISTFHSFCARLLSDHSLRAGINPDLPLLSEIEAAQEMQELMDEFLEEGFREAYPSFDPLSSEAYSWVDGGPSGDAQQVIAQLRNQAVQLHEFQQEVKAVKDKTDAYRILTPLVTWLYGKYTSRLQEHGQLDFDRQIMDAAALLEENSDLRERLRQQYRAVLVDEYQDTNYAQERLLRVMGSDGQANVTVVGDPRQAIYVWREARVENIARFPGGGLRYEAPLTENWRSLKPILDVANRAIDGYELEQQPEFIPGDILYPCVDNEAFTLPVVTLQAAATREEEAKTVVAWVRDALAHGFQYRDIAILIRARTYLSTYTDALKATGIPFELSAETAFYTRPEILDAIHLLHVCIDPSRELSLARVLCSSVVGLAQNEVARLSRSGARHLWPAVLNPAVADMAGEPLERLAQFRGFWQEAQRQRWLLAPAAFLGWALLESGLGGNGDPAARRALNKLLTLGQDYEAMHPADTLSELAAYLALALEFEPPKKAPELNTGADAVRVLTNHAVKGLEFSVVIAIDNRQKVKPSREFNPFHEPDVGLVIPDREVTNLHFDRRMRRMRNEARSLWYVLLTRAKKRLVVTATNEDVAAGAELKGKTFFEELWSKEKADPTPGVELGGAPVEAGPLGAPAPSPDWHTQQPAAEALREQLGIRVSNGKPNFRFSATAFRRYQQCPAAYRLYHLTGLGGILEAQDGDVEQGAAGGMLLGQLFHAAVAAHAGRPDAGRGDLLQAIPLEIWDTLDGEQQARLQKWIDLYLQSELAGNVPAVESVERPLTLTLEFDSARLILRGIADRIEPSRLVDYKTEADSGALVEEYEDQLRLYALAARGEGLLAPDALLVLYHAPTGTQIPVPFDEKDQKRLLGSLESFASTLAHPAAAFPSRPGAFCLWCAGRGVICPVGKNVVL